MLEQEERRIKHRLEQKLANTPSPKGKGKEKERTRWRKKMVRGPRGGTV